MIAQPSVRSSNVAKEEKPIDEHPIKTKIQPHQARDRVAANIVIGGIPRKVLQGVGMFSSAWRRQEIVRKTAIRHAGLVAKNQKLVELGPRQWNLVDGFEPSDDPLVIKAEPALNPTGL
ncbi:MAG: hypothetical protein H6729_15630 [Deltaproteobacteria bacterium]|nr:hypothetical protein [Deltaproteobacteria bacterium]